MAGMAGTPDKTHAATLKDQQRERDRLTTENLNLKLRIKYLEDLFGDSPGGLPTVWDPATLEGESQRMMKIVLEEIADKDQMLHDAACDLEKKDAKLEKAREDLSRKERYFSSLKKRLELAEGRKIDDAELWATAGPDVAELEERCRQAQAEAEAVLAQGRSDCEALEDEVRAFRADRDELLSQLAAERQASSERRDEAASKDKELAVALQKMASAKEEAKRQRQEVEVLHREITALRSAGTPSGPKREAEGLRAALAHAEEELEGAKCAQRQLEQEVRVARSQCDALAEDVRGVKDEKYRLASELETRKGDASQHTQDLRRELATAHSDLVEVHRERDALLERARLREREHARERDALLSELQEARATVQELQSKWERARAEVKRHAAEREQLNAEYRAALARRRTPPPEADKARMDASEAKLRECNRVLILELEDTRRRLTQEKTLRSQSAAPAPRAGHGPLEVSCIAMSASAVREASQGPAPPPRHTGQSTVTAGRDFLYDTPSRGDAKTLSASGTRRHPLGAVNR